jgi:hypothetical protein
MKSPYKFIISPKENKQYDNTVKVGDKELVLSTSIENAEDVQRHAIIQSLPMKYQGELKVGDEVIVHHNIFRITYSDKGVPLQSNFYIKDNLFYAKEDTIFMVIRDGKKRGVHGNCFVQPFEIVHPIAGKGNLPHVGIVKYGCKELEETNVFENQKIVFKRYCEYEFLIDNEKLYKIDHKNILAKLSH